MNRVTMLGSANEREACGRKDPGQGKNFLDFRLTALERKTSLIVRSISYPEGRLPLTTSRTPALNLPGFSW